MSKETKIVLAVLFAIVVADLFLLYFVHVQVKKLGTLEQMRDNWYSSKIEDR